MLGNDQYECAEYVNTKGDSLVLVQIGTIILGVFDPWKSSPAKQPTEMIKMAQTTGLLIIADFAGTVVVVDRRTKPSSVHNFYKRRLSSALEAVQAFYEESDDSIRPVPSSRGIGGPMV